MHKQTTTTARSQMQKLKLTLAFVGDKNDFNAAGEKRFVKYGLL